MNNEYQKWLSGNDCCCGGFIHIEPCDKHKDVCDCDNILLEISKLHTDDEVLQEQIDALSGITTDAYTKQEADERFQPIGNYQPAGDYALRSDIPSLSGYATQTWVQNQGYVNQLKTINNISLIGEGNIQIGSGGTIDAYTKAESDERFQPKGDYVSNTTFIQYITNLTQQITSLQEAIENCCTGQTGETLYRWITLTGENDYICSGTTKYAKEQKQQSTDNGATWTNVSPAEYRTGTLIETNSPDCGYEPVIEYRWVTVQGGYVCSGTTKYNQEKQQYRVDGGAWIDTDPLETRRGSTVIETNSTDCGYIAPQYRWYQAPESDYLCSGTSKYYKEYYQVSNDGGSTWQNVTPTQARQGALIENNSTDCGYVPTPIKFKGQRYGGGEITVNCNSSGELTKGEINTSVYQYTSIEIGDCVTSIGEKAFVNDAYLTGVTIPSGVTSIGYMSFANCGISYLNLNEGLLTIDASFKACHNLTSVTIPNSVTAITGDAFYTDPLQTIVIGSGIRSIAAMAFQSSTPHQSITILATTPPTIANSNIFEDGSNTCPIYVPSGSVNAYKTASGWNNLASRIQAIP